MKVIDNKMPIEKKIKYVLIYLLAIGLSILVALL